MHARQRRQAMQPRHAAQPLIINDKAVTALPATAALPKVAIDPATATLDTVPAEPATSALPTVARDAITPTPAVVATDNGARRNFINIEPASQALGDRAGVRFSMAPINA